jgi:hypothetical protein
MDPDFLCSLSKSMSLTRLSVKKAAYADLSRAAYRKSKGILGALLLHENALAVLFLPLTYALKLAAARQPAPFANQSFPQPVKAESFWGLLRKD